MERPQPSAGLRIVAIDDQQAMLKMIRRTLGRAGIDVTTFDDPRAGRRHVIEHADAIDAVLLDVDMPGMSGLELLAELRSSAPGVPVIMVTGDRSPETTRAALDGGAFDYLRKPIEDTGELILAAHRAAEHGQLARRAAELERRLDEGKGMGAILGASPAMQRLFEVIDRVAGLEVVVLIVGESGSGKELVAQAIHDRSARARRPFVALNCAALPEALVDSELFGHRRGAFTGAVESRPGAFTRAEGGTLFLDEIGDLPAPVQGRLLRVLQEGEFSPVGGGEPQPTNVRLVAATHVDLEEAVSSGRFRDDLYYRLNVVKLAVPPLRDRAGDVPLLVRHFVDKHADRLGRLRPEVPDELCAALARRPWPGNVRQLENTIVAALALSRGRVLDVAAVPDEERAEPLPGPTLAVATAAADVAWAMDLPIRAARDQLVEAFERAYLAALLARCEGNLSEAARQSGMDRTNLRRKLRSLGFE